MTPMKGYPRINPHQLLLLSMHLLTSSPYTLATDPNIQTSTSSLVLYSYNKFIVSHSAPTGHLSSDEWLPHTKEEPCYLDIDDRVVNLINKRLDGNLWESLNEFLRGVPTEDPPTMQQHSPFNFFPTGFRQRAEEASRKPSVSLVAF